MIHSVSITNFKSFKDKIVRTAPLTVLTGLSGSGKSTFLQVLLLLKKYATLDAEPVRVDLSAAPLELGSQGGTQYCYGLDLDKIYLGVTSEDWDEHYSCSLNLDDPNSDTVLLQRMHLQPAESRSAMKDPERLVEFLGGIQYISALRYGPKDEYDYSSVRVQDKTWGKFGENAVAFLAEKGDTFTVNSLLRREGVDSPILREQVNAWMQVIAPGVSVFGRRSSPTKVKLAYSFDEGRVGSVEFTPQNVGFGITYVLPLVIMLLSAKEGDCLALENPEAHIHPQGQAELGILLAQAAAAGAQVFVETHSDHLINGIRVAVARKTGGISARDVVVNYFRRKRPEDESAPFELFTAVDQIDVSATSELSAYPEGFLDEWDNRLVEILRHHERVS